MDQAEAEVASPQFDRSKRQKLGESELNEPHENEIENETLVEDKPLQYSRFASVYEFHHILNDWGMPFFAFNSGKERPSDRSVTITYTCCRSNEGKNCSFEVRGSKRKDEDFWTLKKVDAKGKGHNHGSEMSQEQQVLIDLAERQRLCDIPSFYHVSLPPRFEEYSSSDLLLAGLNSWAEGFFFKQGTNWSKKTGDEKQTFYCGVSGCSYAVTGVRLANEKTWAIRTYNARHIEHNHDHVSKELTSTVALPPITESYSSFSDLHSALNGWSVQHNFAFKTGNSSTGHTNGLVSKYMVCCMVGESGEPCPYSVIVKEARDSSWSLSQANMARKNHNHDIDSELTEEQKVLLDAAETRRIIQKPDYAPEHLPSRTVTFPDKPALVQYLHQFAKERHFKLVIRRSKTELNGQKLLHYECSRDRKTANKCPYHIYARESKDGVWRVSFPYNLKNEHNHGLGETGETELLETEE